MIRDYFLSSFNVFIFSSESPEPTRFYNFYESNTLSASINHNFSFYLLENNFAHTDFQDHIFRLRI